MKVTKFLILVVGFLFGLALAGLLFVSWEIRNRPPSGSSYFPAPPFKGTLIIRLVNATRRSIDAVVALDNESVMAGALPGRSPIPFPHDFDAFAAFSPSFGKYELSVIVGDVGKIGTKEIAQEANKTNYVVIFIRQIGFGTNQLDCKFSVHTNVVGWM
jgi:hypothetical protein